MVAVALSTGLVAEDDSCDDRDEQDRENFDDAKVYLHRGRGWHTVVVVSTFSNTVGTGCCLAIAKHYQTIIQSQTNRCSLVNVVYPLAENVSRIHSHH
jgi:hypothetical protein